MDADATLRLFLDPAGAIVDVAGEADVARIATRARSPASLLLRLARTAPWPAALAAARDVVGDRGALVLLFDNLWPARAAATVRLLRGRGTAGRGVGAPLSLRAAHEALRTAGRGTVHGYAVTPSSVAPSNFVPCAGWRLGWARGCLLSTEALSSVLAELMRQVEAVLGEAGPAARCVLERVSASPKAKTLVFARAGDAHLVLRLPHAPRALDVEARAHALLTDLQRNSAVARQIPLALASGQAGHQAYFAETAIEGRPLAAAVTAAARAGCVREAEDFLNALNPDLAQRAPAALANGPLAVRTQAMLERVLGCIDDPALRHATRLWEQAAVAGAVCRTGIEHGDFSASNLLVRGGRLRGVIDWENALPEGLPVLDAFNYLDSVQRHSASDLTIADTLALLAAGRWPQRDEWSFLQRSFERCAVAPRHRTGFALLYALRHFDAQLGFGAPAPRHRALMRETLERLIRLPP